MKIYSGVFGLCRLSNAYTMFGPLELSEKVGSGNGVMILANYRVRVKLVIELLWSNDRVMAV